MGNYASILTIHNTNDDHSDDGTLHEQHLSQVRTILQDNNRTFEEFSSTFFVEISAATQESRILAALNLLADLKYTFAHIAYLDSTFVKGNGIDQAKLTRIATILT